MDLDVGTNFKFWLDLEIKDMRGVDSAILIMLLRHSHNPIRKALGGKEQEGAERQNFSARTAFHCLFRHSHCNSMRINGVRAES